MIPITTISIILTLTLFLIGISLYFKKNAYLLGILGGVILLLTSVITLTTDPISYQIGQQDNYTYGNNYTQNWNDNTTQPTNTTLNLFSITKTNQYQPINTTINTVLSFALILLSLATIIGISILMNDAKYEEEDQNTILEQ